MIPLRQDADTSIATIGATENIFVLGKGELLFREGDIKSHVYRIESGAICTYEAASPAPRRTYDLAYRGDWLGFGYLDHHVSRARALIETRVSYHPRSRANRIAESDARAGRQLAEAIEREFEFQRDNNGQRNANPLVRVTAFLLSLASQNRHDGRDPHMVIDALPSGLVADCLLMDIDTLTSAVNALRRDGLIEVTARAIRLVNIAAMEQIVDGR